MRALLLILTLVIASLVSVGGNLVCERRYMDPTDQYYRDARQKIEQQILEAEALGTDTASLRAEHLRLTREWQVHVKQRQEKNNSPDVPSDAKSPRSALRTTGAARATPGP